MGNMANTATEVNAQRGRQKDELGEAETTFRQSSVKNYSECMNRSERLVS